MVYKNAAARWIHSVVALLPKDGIENKLIVEELLGIHKVADTALTVKNGIIGMGIEKLRSGVTAELLQQGIDGAVLGTDCTEGDLVISVIKLAVIAAAVERINVAIAAKLGTPGGDKPICNEG